MALSEDSVKLAISILKQINKGASVVECEHETHLTSYTDTDKIFCVNEIYDGYEDVFTNIENMSNDQLQLWDKLKEGVPHSSFINPLEENDYPSHSQWEKNRNKNITCIGWF